MSCDFRLGRVPARDWPAGSERPIVKFRAEFPRTGVFFFGENRFEKRHLTRSRGRGVYSIGDMYSISCVAVVV